VNKVRTFLGAVLLFSRRLLVACILWIEEINASAVCYTAGYDMITGLRPYVCLV